MRSLTGNASIYSKRGVERSPLAPLRLNKVTIPSILLIPSLTLMQDDLQRERSRLSHKFSFLGLAQSTAVRETSSALTGQRLCSSTHFSHKNLTKVDKFDTLRLATRCWRTTALRFPFAFPLLPRCPRREVERLRLNCMLQPQLDSRLWSSSVILPTKNLPSRYAGGSRCLHAFHAPIHVRDSLRGGLRIATSLPGP